jgi:hypothetical protein
MLIKKQGSFVELNRRFRKLEQKAKAEDAAVESYTDGFSWRMSLSWDDLLKENRAVVLGEPGSGKSWELQERARALNSQGSFAFFVRLDQLVERDLPNVFNTDEQGRFNRWKESREVAFFFLDSVDEAKFRKISDFHATLKRFCKELGSDLLLRTKIFLSSRISEWKPSTDAFEFQRLFPLPPVEKRIGESQSKEIEKPSPELLVVQLEPLDRNQVESFAGANGVSDVQAFAQALDLAFAWQFARRPLDVADLISFWNKNKRIGSLTELIEFDVTSKLCPRAGRDELPLSEAEGREGAEWLAATSVFSRKFSFGVPDDGFANDESLNPRACLPSCWREDQTRALLNRAIFDSAVYGHFRFHHRRVGEYLAAKWIAARMEKGCPQHVLEQLLVEIVRGRKVLRPSLCSVAAWLCCGSNQWSQLVRSLVVDTDPGIHLRYGDPARLSIAYRRQVLSALSRLSKKRRRMWIESSPDCLTRLADVALAPDIAALISDREAAVDFRIELLDIVRHGRLVACGDAALRIVATPDDEALDGRSRLELEELKCHAALAIGALGDPGYDARLFQVVLQLPCIFSKLCTSVVQALYPRSISSVELVQLLEKALPEVTTAVISPFHIEMHLESVLTPHEAGELLKRLVVLAGRPPVVMLRQETFPASLQLKWVEDLVPTVFKIVLQSNTLSSEDIETCAEALKLLGHIRECRASDHDDRGELNKATLSYPAIRRSFLWRIAAGFREKHKKEPTMAAELFDYWEILHLCPEDFSWLVEEIRGRTELNDRLLALRLAIEVWDASGRTSGNRLRLRRAAANHPLLLTAFRKSVVTGPLFPLRRYWWRNVRYKYGKWWWQRKFDSVIKRMRWLRDQFHLLRNLRLIESGKQIKWLELLSREADKQNYSRWAPEKWSDLEKKRGKWITRATRRGCVATWRTFTPDLPHEKPKPNETSIGILVGLTGLQVEFQENATAVAKLSEQEAKLAARYAMDELNGFPSWFETLAAAHPKAVSQILCECIEAEWHFPAERQQTHEVLARLAWHGNAQLPLVRDKLLSLLGAGDPPNRAILRYGISLLMRQANPPLDQFAQFAAQRTSSMTDSDRIALWLSVWMQIDGEAAVTRLEAVLKSSSNSDDIVVRLCSILSGEEIERGPFVANPSFFRPACLRRFIPIVYQHVRFSDDLDRSGGAYSPTARDHAERFRSTLLNRLENDEDSTATAVLRELADDPAMPQVRDWILNLLDKRLVNEADSVPWTPADIREFAEHNEVDPKNDRELFAIARKRLQVLKWDVEQSDNSARTELRKDDREMFLRSWLQRRLVERSQKRYTIPQEGEIDQQERPDLRLENPRTGPVSIEIKWADSWTLPQLLERLENQLVGQYLRAHNSQYGIYFLGFIGKKQRWEDPATSKSLSFGEVVEIVKQRANALAQSNPKIAGLEVVSIDFRQPGNI